MRHKIGYACINTSIDATTNRTCKLNNCTEERLRELITSNLNGLKEIINWNIKHNIYLYRMSSAIIPFASHPINAIQWWEDYKDKFDEIGNLIKKSKSRVSMHPGQFVNINSPNPDVVQASIKELQWHTRLLEALELDQTHRLILHTGGVYGNKPDAIDRFIKVCNDLPVNIRKRLSLENDDKSYTVWDVLNISQRTAIPVVFDILHHKINNTGETRDNDMEYILKSCFATWNSSTGIPKIHFSTQKKDAKRGSHAEAINMNDFVEFYNKFKHLDFDIMFETKDKEKSVLNAFKTLAQTLGENGIRNDYNKIRNNKVK